MMKEQMKYAKNLKKWLLKEKERNLKHVDKIKERKVFRVNNSIQRKLNQENGI